METSLITIEERTQIEKKLADVRQRNYFEILECLPDETLSRIEEKYRRLSYFYNPARFVGRVSEDQMDEIKTIHRVIEDAFGVLSDPGRRSSYRHALRLF
ncbi:MAG: DnaJ domain-containing protein [Deltaproteobacteria bacterium]|nr:DnaJ domain-containing protein [Deltaproteobacteria bacterium]